MLGLKKSFEMDGWAEFNGGGQDEAAVGISTGQYTPKEHGATIVLRVDDIERERKRLESSGVKFEGKTEEIPGMVKLAMFRDPSGNRLQLCQVLMNGRARFVAECFAGRVSRRPRQTGSIRRNRCKLSRPGPQGEIAERESTMTGYSQPPLPQDDESKLVERAQQGDRDAFGSLVEPWRKPLFGYIYRMVTLRQDAEDLLQDVFVRVLENIRSIAAKRASKAGSSASPRTPVSTICERGNAGVWKRSVSASRKPPSIPNSSKACAI